jgi:hypothetical protein
LPGDVQGRVEARELAPSVAYEVSRLDDPETQREIVRRIEAEGLKRDEVMEAVRETVGRSGRSIGGGKGRGASKAKARKVTSRTLRTSAGYRIMVEHRRGIEPQGNALGQAEAPQQGRGEAAA